MQLKRPQGFALLEAIIALTIVTASILALIAWLEQLVIQQHENLQLASAHQHAGPYQSHSNQSIRN
jgi:Tfp pilus assembly protein PilV